MRKLPAPIQTARPIFEACAGCKKNGELQSRLLAGGAAIEVAEQAYLRHGADRTLYMIVQTNTVNGNVTAKEMISLYKDTLVKDQRTRPSYDVILLSARICPLCNLREVTQLDHYLAKSSYPVYAVTPANLVPSCADCNHKKLNRLPTTECTQMLHPYFDDIEQGEWLRADVDEGHPPVLTFSVERCADWSAVMHQRVLHHFGSLCLAKLYSLYAAEELVQMDHLLRKLANSGGSAAVTSYLAEQAESRRAAGRNCWQAAMYLALASSQGFCDGGHRTIRRAHSDASL